VSIPAAPAPLSPATWRRVRLALTAGLFAVATVAGVGVGLQGAAVSPVAPATATTAGAAAPTAPVAGDRPGTPAGHRVRR
jgi:hypothetical protein